MKIRSITFFARLATGQPPAAPALGIFANHTHALFTQEGFEVETLRLALPPFSNFVDRDILRNRPKALYRRHAEGFEYLSLGPAQTYNPEAYQPSRKRWR
jgi:hypothetical protein